MEVHLPTLHCLEILQKCHRHLQDLQPLEARPALEDPKVLEHHQHPQRPAPLLDLEDRRLLPDQLRLLIQLLPLLPQDLEVRRLLPGQLRLLRLRFLVGP